MQNLPLYLPLLFAAATGVTLFCFYKASQNNQRMLVFLLLWLAVQAILGLSSFYLNTSTMPPRFTLTIFPAVAAIAWLFASKRGRSLLDRFDAKWLTVLHVVRVPVEAGLLFLFLHKQVPELMTFEGRNFDVLSGLTALPVFYFGYVKKYLGRRFLLAWNLICLGLLANIVGNAILAAPFPFQKFAFDQPNVAVLYFPYVWLPAFIVPAVLFSHLASIRQLLQKKTVAEVLHRPQLA